MNTYEVLGHSWYVFARLFTNPFEAEQAWKSLVVVSADEAGRLQIAGYRLLWEGRPVLVAVVGHLPETVADAEGMIGGEEFELSEESWRPLIMRRARFISAALAEQAPKGVYVTTREGRDKARRLDEEGNVVEEVDVE